MSFWCGVDLVEELGSNGKTGSGPLHGEEEIVVLVGTEDGLLLVLILRVEDDARWREVHDGPIGGDGSHLQYMLSPASNELCEPAALKKLLISASTH